MVALAFATKSVIRFFGQAGDPRSKLIAGLEAYESFYPIALMALSCAGVAIVVVFCVFHRAKRPLRLLSRLMLLWVTLAIGFVLGEGTSWAILAWRHRTPGMPSWPKPSSRSVADLEASSGNTSDVRLVVVGESSAEGVPYRDWVSVGKIVTWQLRKAIPSRMFHLEVQARAGWTLEQMQQRLATMKTRPDAVIIYAGHNEFASRLGWSQAVPYYPEDQPRGFLPKLAAKVREASFVCGLIEETRQRELVASPPTRSQ